MKSKILFLSLILYSFSIIQVQATVDYLVVNHLTQQLYWAETDHPPGWLGWENIPEGIYLSEEAKYLSLGYSFTQNPFLLEEIILIILLCTVFLGFLLKRKKTFR